MGDGRNKEDAENAKDENDYKNFQGCRGGAGDAGLLAGDAGDTEDAENAKDENDYKNFQGCGGGGVSQGRGLPRLSGVWAGQLRGAGHSCCQPRCSSEKPCPQVSRRDKVMIV